MPRVIALLLTFALLACKSNEPEPPTVAVLAQATGPVERAPKGTAFKAIAFGAKLHLGDHVRTGAGTAELALSDGGKVLMDPNTTIVLRARDQRMQLEIGAGTAVLDGKGTYAVEMGEVRLVDGRVRLTATDGKPSLELVLGQGVLVATGGEQRALELGQVMLLEMGKVTMVGGPVDAGVPEEAVPEDASSEPDGVAIEVTGDGAKYQLQGEKTWTKLPAGTARVPGRSRLVLDGKTSAKLTTPGAVLSLAGGSRVLISETFDVTIEAGSVVAAVAAGQATSFTLPGGTVAPVTTATDAAETRIDVDKRGDARVAALAGGVKLTGKRAGSSPLELEVGGNAVLRAAGRAEPGDTVIPAYFDHELAVGAMPAVTIHDPAGATAVRFAFAEKCPGTGAIEVDKDASFKAPRITAGKDGANLLVRGGSWTYRLRCGGAGAAVASGRIVVLRDRGTRPLPKDPPRYPIDADGRTYRLSYQSLIPDVQIRARGTGPAELHLFNGKNEQVLKSQDGTFAVSGTTLRETDYTFHVVQSGVKSKTTTLKIGFDQTAAQVYIEAPGEGQAWGPQVEVRGATLPGWTAQIGGVDVPADKNTRRFRATIAPPDKARAIAIQLAHPQRGVHVYLRRGSGKAP